MIAREVAIGWLKKSEYALKHSQVGLIDQFCVINRYLWRDFAIFITEEKPSCRLKWLWLSKFKVKHRRLHLKVKDTEKLPSKVTRNELTDSVKCRFQSKQLGLDLEILRFSFVPLHVLFPLLGSAYVCQVRKPQLAFETQIRVQVAWHHIYLTPDQHHIVYLNFLFTVAYQK